MQPSFLSILVDLVVAAAVFAVVLMVVDKLNMGLSVGSFGNAFIAAVGIAVVAVLGLWVLSLLNITIAMTGLLGFIVAIVAAAIVLLIAAKVIPNFTVNGFGGAVIAAIAIGVCYWIIDVVTAMFGF